MTEAPFPFALSSPEFSKDWTLIYEEKLGAWIKNKYSPDARWKGKPFQKADIEFFSKGLLELSELLTEERTDSGSRQFPDYFQHKKFRSAYFLYFFPLHGAKFYSLYQSHSLALVRAIDEAQAANRPIKILDLGAGPGTASLAFLMWLKFAKIDLKVPIELHWVDRNRSVLAEGKDFLRSIETDLALNVPLAIRFHSEEIEKLAFAEKDFTLTVAGNIFNEGRVSLKKATSISERCLSITSGAGMLFVEPAAKPSSQFLSQLRNELLLTEGLKKRMLWGPCLHIETCPLAMGQNWCHFSVPIKVPGKTFLEFSKELGSERLWLKFSYFWIASETISPPAVKTPFVRRVVSDPIPSRDHKIWEILLCEPEQVGRHELPFHEKVLRGDLFTMLKNKPAVAPSTAASRVKPLPLKKK